MKKILVLSFAVAAAAANAQVWSGAGGAIPDNIPAGANFTINAVPGLTSVSAIAIRGLYHSWAGDVIATVTHVPSSTTVTLFSRPGYTGTGFGSSANFGSTGTTGQPGGDYIFQVSGASLHALGLVTTGTAVLAPGTYQSENQGGAANGFFGGSYAAGDWVLNVSDAASGDTGAFASWEIRGQAVPEPATLAVLGLGALAAARRRRSK